MTIKRVSEGLDQLMNKWFDEGVSVSQISLKAQVDYLTAYRHTRLRRRINPETGKPFESLSKYRKYLSKRTQQQPTNQVPSEKPINHEQEGLEVSLVSALWGLEGVPPPTKFGYNDFAALFALAYSHGFRVSVYPRDINRALNVSIFTQEAERLTPKQLQPYFEKLEQLGLITGASETGYSMDNRLVRIIFDNFDRFVTPGLKVRGFWSSVNAWYRLD